MSPGDGALDAAAGRLERALTRIEQRLGEREGAGGPLFAGDGGDLAAELEASRARERALEAAGADASTALGRAITQIHAALGERVAEPQES